MPTVRSLATQLKVNFNTVARAYRLLDEAGIISTQQGRGTYILSAAADNPGSEFKALDELTKKFLNQAAELGVSGGEVLAVFQRNLREWNQTGQEKMDETANKEYLK